MASSPGYPAKSDHAIPGTVRERLFRFGPDALSPSELLGIVIREGRGEEEAVAIAKNLIERFGGLRGQSRGGRAAAG